MAISYDGIGQLCVSMNFEGTIKTGTPCVISKSNIVKAAENEQAFCGIVGNVSGSLANVILRGFVTVGYNGDAPWVGPCAMVADGSGKVTRNEEGNTYLVVNLNTTEKTVTFLI